MGEDIKEDSSGLLEEEPNEGSRVNECDFRNETIDGKNWVVLEGDCKFTLPDIDNGEIQYKVSVENGLMIVASVDLNYLIDIAPASSKISVEAKCSIDPSTMNTDSPEPYDCDISQATEPMGLIKLDTVLISFDGETSLEITKDELSEHLYSFKRLENTGGVIVENDPAGILAEMRDCTDATLDTSVPAFDLGNCLNGMEILEEVEGGDVSINTSVSGGVKLEDAGAGIHEDVSTSGLSDISSGDAVYEDAGEGCGCKTINVNQKYNSLPPSVTAFLFLFAWAVVRKSAKMNMSKFLQLAQHSPKFLQNLISQGLKSTIKK